MGIKLIFSILSCELKCLKILKMVLKKILLITIFITILNSCVQNTALVGSAITLANTGNTYQAGLSYGSSKIITKVTGKTTSRHIIEILVPKEEGTNLKQWLKKE